MIKLLFIDSVYDRLDTLFCDCPVSGVPMGVPGQDNTLHGYLLRWSTSHHHNVHNTQQHTPPQHPFRNITRFKPHTLVCRYFPIRHILSVSKVAAQEALILTCSRSSMIYQIYSGQFGSQSTCCNVVMLPPARFRNLRDDSS